VHGAEKIVVSVVVVAGAMLCLIQRRSVMSYEGLQQVGPRWYAGAACGALEDQQPVRLAGSWWLVLVCSERKVLLAGC
jgi:hypothetical protein